VVRYPTAFGSKGAFGKAVITRGIVTNRTVIPEIETVLELMLKTRTLMTLAFTCTVKRLAPGPVMVRFLSITNSPLVRITVVMLERN